MSTRKLTNNARFFGRHSCCRFTASQRYWIIGVRFLRRFWYVYLYIHRFWIESATSALVRKIHLKHANHNIRLLLFIWRSSYIRIFTRFCWYFKLIYWWQHTHTPFKQSGYIFIELTSLTGAICNVSPIPNRSVIIFVLIKLMLSVHVWEIKT